jgi:hypothetical protein
VYTEYRGKGLGRKVIFRLAFKRVSERRIDNVEVRSISGTEIFRIKVYNVELDSLIVQDPSSTDPIRYNGSISVLPYPWESYCKWHSGPLDAKDNPWERIYCNVRAEGYCRQHRRTERYLYDMCMSLKGERALEACKVLDKNVKTEYAVYMLDSGGTKPKVGTTRAFRLLERISEQKHVVATLLAIYDSAYEARRAEMKISELGIASEHQRRTLRPKLSAHEAILRLYEAANKASKILGQEWNGKLFTIEPPKDMPYPVNVERVMGVEAYPIGYWGGLLLLRSANGDFAIEERPLLHRLSIEIPETLEEEFRGFMLRG